MANFEIRAKLLIAFQQPDTIHALYLAFAHTRTLARKCIGVPLTT